VGACVGIGLGRLCRGIMVRQGLLSRPFTRGDHFPAHPVICLPAKFEQSRTVHGQDSDLTDWTWPLSTTLDF